MAVNIFFCYAHEDEDLLNKLKRHLWPLQRQGLIAVWHDRDISAGTEWELDIKKHLNEADIILLLVSPDFMYSEYCYGIEMQRALERHDRGEAKVIPVILRPVDWQGMLGKLQALPKDGLPITDPEWHTLDRALYNVTVGIRNVVEHISAKLAAQAVEEQQMQFSASSVETPAHIQAAEPTKPVVNEPKPASSTPIKGREAEPTLSTMHVSKPAPATPLSSLKPEVVSLLRTLTGHTGGVSSVAFSPDGQTLVSGSYDKMIKVWNLSTGQELRTLTGHTDWIRSVAISADGQTLASGNGETLASRSSSDYTIKLWNLATGKELRTLFGHSYTVHSVAFSPDGQTLASGSEDQTIKLWDVATGKQVRTLTGHAGSVHSVAFSPDGQTLASGNGETLASRSSSDYTIKLWNLATGKELRTLFGHSYTVHSVAFSPDRQTLATSSGDGTIKLWDVATGKQVRTLTGHTGGVSSVAFSPDGQTLASGSWDWTIKLWDVATGKQVRTLTGHTGSVHSVAFSPDGQTLASGSSDKTIKIWGKN